MIHTVGIFKNKSVCKRELHIDKFTKWLTSTIVVLLVGVSSVFAQTNIKVDSFLLKGPYTFDKPLSTGSVNAKGEKLSEDYLFEYIPQKADYKEFNGKVLPSDENLYTAGSLLFYLHNQNFVKGRLKIEGIKKYRVFVDEAELKGNNLKLNPPYHKVEIKFIVAPQSVDSLKVAIESDKPLNYSLSAKHYFDLSDMLYGKRISSGQISPDGNYLIVSYNDTDKKGTARRTQQIKELSSGKVVAERNGMRWMPSSACYIVEERNGEVRELYKVDPRTAQKELWVKNLPSGSWTIAPNEEYLIITSSEEGIKENRDVYQIITPDDRQPGWRNRSYLILYDIESQVARRITFGNYSSRLIDISQDGKKLIIGVNREQIEKRPHTTTDYLLVDAKTLKTDTLFVGEDFLSDLKFSPDGKQLLAKGSPEVFNRIGAMVKKGQTPSMYDMQLYIVDIATKNIKPLTKNFKPSIDSYQWNKVDGQIYTTVTEGEYKNFYTIDPKNGKISRIDMGVDVVGSYSISENRIVAYTGSGATKPVALYTLDLKSRKSKLYEDCTEDIYRNVIMGECKEWNFVNRLKDTIQGRFYLPPDFDSSKQYPLIVNYYGGCTPTTRGLENRYPQEYYASLGYVVYVIQPSGAIGFGQEFSARHVGTWGKGVAEDIIEGVRKFCAEHKFVNSAKIGCIGASYGGFMTMYLQTVTDIFACAISHAGISNIASYWGEGYWGYSYGHVASGENYPWNAKEMYVNQSPLFNADKINTPLLLLHGSADTNVPHIESIQMFTALKILGKECAFVEFKDENHWILEYSKRIKWSNTIMAWFQKYLKDDPSWWNELYPQKSW